MLARRRMGGGEFAPPAPDPVPASDPRDVELAALRARVAELEALLASATEPPPAAAAKRRG